MDSYTFSKTIINAQNKNTDKTLNTLQQKVVSLDNKFNNKKTILDESKNMVRDMFEMFAASQKQFKTINRQLPQIDMLQAKLEETNIRLTQSENDLAVVLKFMDKILHSYSESDSDVDSESESEEEAPPKKKTKAKKKVKKKLRKRVKKKVKKQE